MIFDAAGMPVNEYVLSFDRRNLIPSGEWDTDRAQVLGQSFREETLGRKIVVLGRDVWTALKLPHKPAPRHRVECFGSAWYYLPHPSGRNHYYNDALHRWWAGRFLADMVRGS